MTERQVVERRGREGGRWINERPTSEDFGLWFNENMKVDEKLTSADYVGGVVLIPAVDRRSPTVIGFTDNGVPIIEDREELSYIPYAKVETRINYFWDLVDAHEEEWVAEVVQEAAPRLPIEPLEATEITQDAEGRVTTKVSHVQAGRLAQMVYQLPTGFWVLSIPVGEGYAHFVCATTRVSIFRRGEDGEPKGRALRTGRGTKMVPFLTGRNPYADPSSLMKAETGALGRALGFAGIFVIPGSGVATAEDVQEAIAQGRTPAEALNDVPETVQPELPPVKTGQEQAEETEEQLRDRAQALWGEVKADPAKSEAFLAWASQRRLGKISDAKGATLRGVVKKLERIKEEVADVPAAPSAEESG